MKKLYLFFFTSLPFLFGHAQYSSDTLNPLSVCNAANSQSAVAALNDGNGGSYIFWLDNRDTSSSNQIFGQHVNSNGDASWMANGKLIAGTTNSIIGFQIARWQNGILMAWVSAVSGYGDSLFCKYVDTSGNDVWAQPTLIAQNGNGYISIDQDGFNVIPNDSGATITHSYTYLGGNTGLAFNRIDFSGNLYWPVLSKTNTLQGYDYRTSTDGGDGFYALSKGNGEGSNMYIQRFSLQGNTLWANGLDITSGGIDGFNGNIAMIPDTASNLYVTWDAYGGNVDVAKVTPSGDFGWAAKRIRLSDTSAYSPGRSYARLIGNNLYVTWLESRIPYVGSSIMQKLDTAGAIIWGAGGLVVATVNVYDTYPKLAAADSNAVVNAFIGPVNSDMNIQRVRNDGSLTWTDNGKVLGSGNPQALSSADYTVLDNVNGCNPVFWTSQNTNIYASDACINNSVATEVEAIEGNGPASLTVFPNPSRNYITVRSDNEQALNSVTVYDVTGRTATTIIQATNSSSLKIDVSKLEPGVYFIQGLSAGIPARNTFVVQ